MILFGLGSIFKRVELDLNQRKHEYKDYLGFWLNSNIHASFDGFSEFFCTLDESLRIVVVETVDLHVLRPSIDCLSVSDWNHFETTSRFLLVYFHMRLWLR